MNSVIFPLRNRKTEHPWTRTGFPVAGIVVPLGPGRSPLWVPMNRLFKHTKSPSPNKRSVSRRTSGNALVYVTTRCLSPSCPRIGLSSSGSSVTTDLSKHARYAFQSFALKASISLLITSMFALLNLSHLFLCPARPSAFPRPRPFELLMRRDFERCEVSRSDYRVRPYDNHDAIRRRHEFLRDVTAKSADGGDLLSCLDLVVQCDVGREHPASAREYVDDVRERLVFFQFLCFARQHSQVTQGVLETSDARFETALCVGSHLGYESGDVPFHEGRHHRRGPFPSLRRRTNPVNDLVEQE